MHTINFKIRLQIFLLVSVCCILCGCQTNNALPVQPTQSVKSPQQLLEEQPIDDAHDAFLVDTGGKLGTLLVTVEEVQKDEMFLHIRFSVWNPAKMEKPIQTFSDKVMMGIAPEFHNVVDANFDGSHDFGYLFDRGNQPNYWHYWLWDEKQAQYIQCEPLGDVSEPQFDAEEKIVTGWARDSASTGIFTFYRWIDGELTLMREIEVAGPNTDRKMVATVEDRIDGQMTEVYRTEWDWLEKTWKLSEKWFDLDYHGEVE